MNSKHTKKALLSSVLALVLCFAMMLGTTFAWFTDTASTGVNKIQAGTLKVDIVDKNGVSLEGKSLNFVKANSSDSNSTPSPESTILWEPGVTYLTEGFQIKNNGNLALKYTMSVSGISGSEKLLEVIEFTVVKAVTDNNETTYVEVTENDGYMGTLSASATSEDTYYISGHMKETAGNAYQGLTLEGVGITVYATQWTEEYDSYTNQYDKDATYGTLVTTDTELKNALAALSTAGSENVSVVLTDDLSLEAGFKVADGNTLNLDFNGNTISADKGTGSGNVTNGMQLLKGSTVTLSNGAYALSTESIGCLIQNYSDLTIENMTLSTDGYTKLGENAINSDMIVISSNCGNVVITGNTKITAANGTIALDIMHWENTSYEEAGSHVTFDENFTGVCDGRIEIYCYNTSNTPTVRDVDDGGATLTIKGGTFKNTDLTLDEFKKYVADGYKVTEVDGVYFVTEKTETVNTESTTVSAETTLTSNVTTVLTTGKGIDTNAGKAMYAVESGATLDGAGYTLTVQNSNDAATVGVLAEKGTVKNLTITGAARGIMLHNVTGDVTLENVTITDCGYALNTAVVTDNSAKLIVKDSTLGGWSSWNRLSSASFTNCKFVKGSYYNSDIYDQYLRPYVTSTFENCDFVQGMHFDLSKLVEGATVTFKNCTCNGVVLTADNAFNYLHFYLDNSDTEPTSAEGFNGYLTFSNT